MKKLLFLLLIFSLLFSLISCSDSTDSFQGIIEETINRDEQAVQDVSIEMLPSRYADYLKSIVPAKNPSEAVYYMEKVITVNGVSTSLTTAVKNGTLLTISNTDDVKSASILTPQALTSIDVVNKTYTQSPIEPYVYDTYMAQVECAKKYSGIEFTSSAYTVIDKDHYAEIAVLDEVARIFIFDDNYIPKYIVYAQSDGALVTEEFITFKADFDENIFVIPSDYIPV